MVACRMTLNEDNPGESQEHSQEGVPPCRIWRCLDPSMQAQDVRNGMTLETILVGILLLAVWVNAGLIVWRSLLG